MDLNILVQKDNQKDSKEVILAKIERAFRFGFNKLALNVHIAFKDVNQIPDPPAIQMPESEKIQIYTRLTVGVNDPLHTHKLTQSNTVKKYDLLSIEPLNEKMLNHLTNGNYECDIITFQMTDRLPFDLKRSNLSLPISKGICFEIVYTDAISNQSARQSVISNSQILVEKTKGKNILLSSGAHSSSTLRSPNDVANMGLLFGLKENQSKEAVFRNAFKVMQRADMRKNINVSAIKVNAQLEPSEKWLLNEFATNK